MHFLTLKDIVYLISLAITIAGFIYRLRSLEDKCNRVMKSLYHENGGLNLINCEQCKSNRDIVFASIRKGERAVEDVAKEIRTLNENVLRILIHLGIDTTK